MSLITSRASNSEKKNKKKIQKVLKTNVERKTKQKTIYAKENREKKMTKN